MEWTKEEFESKFFDIRKHKPKKGQVLAEFSAVAYFVDDWVKRNLINIIQANPVGAETAQKVLRNMCCVIEEDSIRLPLEMAKDLASGMTVEEVAQKEYRMIVKYSYWTEKANIPDDPHWSTIDLLNTDDIDDRCKFTYTFPKS